MEITPEYIATLRKQAYAERERKEALRKKYVDEFLDHHIPNLDHIREMLIEAINRNPDLETYALHILTIGVQPLRDLDMTRNEALDYMKKAYAERFYGWFKCYIPNSTPAFRVVAKKYIEVYALIYSSAKDLRSKE